MTSYALDTNTLIYFFKGEGRVARRLLSESPANVAVPSVVVYELEVGIAKSKNPAKRKNQLERLISAVRLLPFGRAEAAAAAEIRAELELRGARIGPMDNLIAGTALSSGTVLVTRNAEEMKRCPGLKIENWY